MKKTARFYFVCFVWLLMASAQTSSGFILQKYSKELSFVVMDTIHGAQSTVIEYPQFLVLIEVPLIDEGGGKPKNLDEDTLRALQYKQFLHEQFHGKPVKYILSSHWHLHSLSGVSPFTESGTKIITTASNWQYATANHLVSPRRLASVQSGIIKVSADTLLLPQSAYPIKVLYIDTSYHHKPTKDYLFFYLVKQQFLHASCMAAIGANDFSKIGNYLYNARLIDFYRSVTDRSLKVNKVIRLGRENLSGGKFIPGVYDFYEVEKFIANGKSPDVYTEGLKKMTVQQIRLKTDSILSSLAEIGFSADIINNMVYERINKKQYEKGLVISQLLNIYHPGIIEFMDTMGEAYYFNGNLLMAKRISDILGKKDPKWVNRYAEWEKNKKESSL